MQMIPLRLWLLTLLSGTLQVLIFPVAGPLPAWRAALAWVALIPFLLALLGDRTDGGRLRVRDCALLGYLCGFLWYLGSCYWVYQTMHLYGGMSAPAAFGILILFSLYLGLYHALFAVLLGLVRRYTPLQRSGALAAAPFLWVAVELARARVTSFPWDQLGISQVDNSLLTLLAPWAGVYGISFILVLANALLASAWVFKDPQIKKYAVLGGLTLALVILAGGAIHLGQPPIEPGTHTAISLQQNLSVSGPIPAAENLLPLFTSMSTRPSGNRTQINPELILWPETPAPFQTDDPIFLNSLAALSRQSGAGILAGATGIERSTGSPRGAFIYNSAALFLPATGYAARYDKIHLVPFGEFLPYSSLLSFAGGLVREVGSSDRGTARTVLRVHGYGIGTFICYESIFADEVRQFTRGGAQVLANLSNDGWYGDTSAPFQHITMARMRAIENRRWLLRSTNTGITAAIDPYGRVVESAPRHKFLSVLLHYSYSDELTFYTLHGDLFAYLCAALVTALFLWPLYNRLRPHPDSEAVN